MMLFFTAKFSTAKIIATALTIFFVSVLVLIYDGDNYKDLSAGFIYLLWIVPIILAVGYIKLCVHRANRLVP